MSQYVVFRLDKEHYGVDIMNVKEISEYKESNKVPNTPEHILGIVNYRGIVTPIISLRKKFSLSEREADQTTRIIIINLNDKQIGFVVDEASQVKTIDSKNIESGQNIFLSIEDKFISGIAKEEDDMIILLDLEKVLSEDDKEHLENLEQ